MNSAVCPLPPSLAPSLTPCLIGSCLALSLFSIGICSLQRGCPLICEVSGGAGGLHVSDLNSVEGSVSWALCTEMWFVSGTKGASGGWNPARAPLGPASCAGTQAVPFAHLNKDIV